MTKKSFKTKSFETIPYYTCFKTRFLLILINKYEEKCKNCIKCKKENASIVMKKNNLLCKIKL